MHPAAFYIASAILIFSAVMVVTQRSLFTCALYLAVALSVIAGFFVMLSADFLAAMQILLYVGGVIVIMAFAIMLSNLDLLKSEPQVNRQWIPSLLGAGAIAAILFLAVRKSEFAVQASTFSPTTAHIGQLLIRDMGLPFEAVSLILMAALVGAILFSKRRMSK